MTDTQSPEDRPPSKEDERLFALLDGYVQALHEGDDGTRSQLLSRRPELMSLLASLEALDSLAVPLTSVLDDSDPGAVDPTAKTERMPRSGPSPAADDAQTPQQKEFGKYELIEEIGRGGMGVVYKARQIDLDRTVALKMILANHLASADDVTRFYSEARAAGRLTHPNIVRIHEVGQCHGQHYFAMDFVEGDSLADRLRDGPLPPDEAARYVATVAEAVDFLHQHGTVHRDIKPANILIDHSGRPYVTDFGLAMVSSSDSRLTHTGMIVGTPSYMAPEQATGRSGQVTTRCDVYSLGAILYEALTGQPPFKENTPIETLVQVLEGEPPSPHKLQPHIPRDLELICLRCLEKEPTQRYATAADLADDLEHYLKREPIAARPLGALHRLRRWGRREPALVSRWAGLLVAATIVQTRHLLHGSDLAYHLRIMTVFAVWAIVSFVFQRLLHREATANATRFVWAAADALLLTTVLCLADGPLGPLLIGYPLLVAASGLFFRVRMVWFMTGVSLLSFAALMSLRPDEAQPPHYPIVFAAVLVILGIVVAYQVYRVRVLSRFYEQR